MFSYNLEQTPKKVSIQFQGDLDIEVSGIMGDEIVPALKFCKNVEFDFKRVPFVDSTGIGLFIHFVETLKKDGVEHIQIMNIQPLVWDVFEMLRLGEILGEKVILSEGKITEKGRTIY